MIFDKEIVEEQAKRYDSFYLYDERKIVESIRRLKQHFPNIEFLYSIKCNSNPYVINSVFAQGLGADAASAGEVRKAVVAGQKKEKIYYSAAGKSMEDIESTMESAVLIADSIEEIKRIQFAAKHRNLVVEIGIRINPNFSFYKNEGMPSKFGIDEEEALAFLRENRFPNVRVTGIHVHLRSQELNTELLARYYENVLELARRVQKVTDVSLDYVNMGAGMGIPYAVKDRALNLKELGQSVEAAVARFREEFPGIRVMIETGRHVVGKAGVYVTKVMDRKVSHAKTYIILKNTLNGFIRPSLACLVERYWQGQQSPEGSEPLFTGTDAFQFLTLRERKPAERVDLVGNLCTATDIIAENLVMPRLECGDVVVITNAGAYAAVLSPVQFSTQIRPIELFLNEDGNVVEESFTPKLEESLSGQEP
ncbi:diaminopimelate decarboxylase [Blautia hydrogenotrophica]|uniref:diaminopimelate decarboxylase n=1 Tax=Blautia hydrogenotrophica TaxID=53443 RepID=UPI003AB30660